MERAGNGASGKRCDIDGVTRTGELAGVSESSRWTNCIVRWELGWPLCLLATLRTASYDGESHNNLESVR